MNDREDAKPVVIRSRRDLARSFVASAAPAAADRAMRAGLFATLLVGAGGVSLAALLWQNLGDPQTDDAFAAVSFFALCAAFAVALAFAAWLGSCWAVARRTGWNEISLLRWDAASYLALLAFPLLRVAADAPSPVAAWGTLAAFALAKLLPLARFVPAVRDVVVVFGTTRAVVYAIGWIAVATLPTVPGHGPTGDPPLGGWAEWDGAHYLAIAERGYSGTDTAFFPLYPTLLRFGGDLVHGDLVAGIAISNVAFFIGLWFLRDIALRLTRDEATASRTLWYLAIFPASLFFSAAYSEGVFFALTVATFAQLERRNWLFAGVLGGFAALTRLAGAFLIVPFLIEIVNVARTTNLTLREHRRNLVDLLACAACIPLALLAFMLLEGILTGDLLAFEHVQSHWKRAISPPWTSVERSLNLLATSHDRATVAVQAIELGFTLLVVALLIDGIRTLRPAYWWYALFSFLVPLSTSSLMSVPRFAAVVFPLFIVLAGRGSNPIVDRIVVAVSLPLLGLFTAFFVTGHWVA